jgi:hypothetical protein
MPPRFPDITVSLLPGPHESTLMANRASRALRLLASREAWEEFHAELKAAHPNEWDAICMRWVEVVP